MYIQTYLDYASAQVTDTGVKSVLRKSERSQTGARMPGKVLFGVRAPRNGTDERKPACKSHGRHQLRKNLTHRNQLQCSTVDTRVSERKEKIHKTKLCEYATRVLSQILFFVLFLSVLLARPYTCNCANAKPFLLLLFFFSRAKRV